MRINLLVQGALGTTDSCGLALRFANAAWNAGHNVGTVFFYKDAAYIGNQHIRLPQDERSIQRDWADFIAKYPTKLVVCVAAAERRGIRQDINLADGFEIAGLGQLVEAAEDCDRIVTF